MNMIDISTSVLTAMAGQNRTGEEKTDEKIEDRRKAQKMRKHGVI